jgi:ABC-type cobalamin transport system permease subunit
LVSDIEVVWSSWKSLFFKAVERNIPSKFLSSKRNVPWFKAGFPLANFSFVFGLSTGTNWIKTKEKFASRGKIRKWKTGLRAPLTVTLTTHV